MTQTTETLKDAILKAVRSVPIANWVRDVQVESALDEDEEEFLRVTVQVAVPDRNVDAELESLLEKIEDYVIAVDDRYPSVRFLDAA